MCLRAQKKMGHRFHVSQFFCSSVLGLFCFSFFPRFLCAVQVGFVRTLRHHDRRVPASCVMRGRVDRGSPEGGKAATAMAVPVHPMSSHAKVATGDGSGCSLIAGKVISNGQSPAPVLETLSRLAGDRSEGMSALTAFEVEVEVEIEVEVLCALDARTMLPAAVPHDMLIHGSSQPCRWLHVATRSHTLGGKGFAGHIG